MMGILSGLSFLPKCTCPRTRIYQTIKDFQTDYCDMLLGIHFALQTDQNLQVCGIISNGIYTRNILHWDKY